VSEEQNGQNPPAEAPPVSEQEEQLAASDEAIAQEEARAGNPPPATIDEIDKAFGEAAASGNVKPAPDGVIFDAVTNEIVATADNAPRVVCPKCKRQNFKVNRKTFESRCNVCGENFSINPEDLKPVDRAVGLEDEIPGVVAAVARGDMDYLTDERAEWLVREVQRLRYACRTVDTDAVPMHLRAVLKDALRQPQPPADSHEYADDE
jgi:hypothetical protein